MPLNIRKAVVIDDALGPPPPGLVQQAQKDNWADFVFRSEAAVNALNRELFTEQPLDAEALVETLTSQHSHLTRLWHLLRDGKIPEANFALLFEEAEAEMMARAGSANLVVEYLQQLVGTQNVSTFWAYDGATEALAAADVAFVDFYLNNDETEANALDRIAAAAPQLKGPTLLFFMSSQATLEQQQKVREKINRRSAFFDVMLKTDINTDFLDSKIGTKRESFDSNRALENVINQAVDAANAAVAEFRVRCAELEVHDLRLLNLTRLEAEGESLQEYLTWLFSEALAAKTRRLALSHVQDSVIEPAAIGFSGQVSQGTVLFDLFSEVVFGPPLAADKGIRFGEVFQCVAEPNEYLVVLTPACDLQRCDPDKTVLCARALALDYSGPREITKSKLFGKLNEGKLCHLLTTGSSGNGKPIFSLLTWASARITTLTVAELKAAEYRRVALMNEIFAQEVKEDVLRVLGRVGTQIDPPPPQALDAVLSWKTAAGNAWQTEATPANRFASALLTFSADKNGAVAVISDEFKLWAKRKIFDSFDGPPPESLTRCLTTLAAESQFKMNKAFKCESGALTVRLIDPTLNPPNEPNAWIVITLLTGSPQEQNEDDG
ncbi:hypothetical protein [Aquitalea aquatilis]|uniref:hypothetical protein n=1 Tax=Aquitalea aquatilis TaxID=1537400 RepID=UPI0010BDAE1A|nr:hypothetical protein [Aquitalea aquatilis]